MNFREFFYNEAPPVPDQRYLDMEVANLYFQGNVTVRELAKRTGKSIGEVYRMIRSVGQPNRRQPRHNDVWSLADSGLGSQSISDLTGYTTRHVRNILKKRA